MYIKEIYLLDYKHYESGSLTYGIYCKDRMLNNLKEKYEIAV